MKFIKIFLSEPTDVLSKFSSNAENFNKTRDELQQRLNELERKVSESLQSGCNIAKNTCKSMEVPKIRPPNNWMENGAESLGDQCPWDAKTMRDFRLLFRTLTYIKLP
ncbi:hypothetical protein ACTXT7_009481 [Hymenolepis weldensis]